MTAPQKPWLENLDDATRERVRELVRDSPPLSDEVRHRLRLLFRGGMT